MPISGGKRNCCPIRSPRATKCTKMPAEKASITLARRTCHASVSIKKGLDTFDNDRPTVYGSVGRESGKIRLELLLNTTQAEVGESLRLHRGKHGTCYSDESNAYNKVATATMHHVTVCHSDYEWTRDDDGTESTRCT